MNRLTLRGRIVAALIPAMMLIPSLVQAQTQVKPGFNLFSTQQDVEVGQQSAAEVERQLPIVRDQRVNAYINDLGQRLATQAPGAKFPYQYKVVDASDINAFALPGGFVYVNRGVLEAARNDGEVAGVLAHETAHVALRHGTHQASKAYMTQAGLGILGGLLGGHVGAGAGQIINAVGGFGLNALFLKYSREAETQADVVGAQIMTGAGYSPYDMVNFFKNLERQDSSKKAGWLSDHPAPPQRITRIEKEATLLHAKQTTSTATASLSHVQSTLRSMSPARTTQQIAQMGAAPSQSGNQGSGNQGAGAMSSIRVEAPSSSYSRYASRSHLFNVTYPSNWKVYEGGENSVTMAPEGGAGDVQGKSEVAYGAIIAHYEPFGNVTTRRNNATIEEATDDLVKQLMQSSNYLRVMSGSKKRIRTPDGTALSAVLGGLDPITGMQERITVVTRALDDEHLVYMLFITPERDASAYNGVLNSMVSSLRVDPQHGH
jgi:Zn-dependent protease with chaperone function